MDAGSFALGLVVLTVMVGCAGFAAVRVRRLLLPTFFGAGARLAEVVLGISGLLILSELLGSVGLFRRGPLVVASLLAAGTAARLAPGARRGRTTGAGSPPTWRWAGPVAWATAVFVAVVWTASIAGTLWHGMDNFDTLVYHGPISARFVQTGWVTRLHFTHDQPLFTFSPANSELLHGILALPFRRDFLSPFVALACAELALLAAWCVGRDAGVGGASVVGAGLVVTVPMLTLIQAGQGSNDVVGLAFFLAAAALLLLGDGGWRATLVAGLAAGLAAGTKPPFLAPVAALFVLALVWPRLRACLSPWSWAAGTSATGAFWYVRNLARTGSPLPWAHLPGLSYLAVAEMRDQGWTVAHYLGDGRLWRTDFLPSLRGFFGAAWPLVLGLPVAVLVVVCVRGGTRERAVAVMGLVAFVEYLFTPFSAGGPRGYAWMFFWDLRFVTPALAVGLALLPRLEALRPPRRQGLLVAGLVGLVAVTVTGRTGPWSVFPRTLRPGEVAAGAAVAAAAAAGLWLARAGAGRVVLAAAVVPVALAPLAAYRLEHRYEAGRYAIGTYPVLGLNPNAVFAWAHRLHHTRIAVGGSLRAQYPFYGVDLSNVVQYVGHPGPHGSFGPVATCGEWVQRVNRGGYRYLVVGETPGQPAPEQAWLAQQAGVSQVMDRGGVAVFRLPERLSPLRCGA